MERILKLCVIALLFMNVLQNINQISSYFFFNYLKAQSHDSENKWLIFLALMLTKLYKKETNKYNMIIPNNQLKNIKAII